MVNESYSFCWERNYNNVVLVIYLYVAIKYYKSLLVCFMSTEKMWSHLEK